MAEDRTDEPTRERSERKESATTPESDRSPTTERRPSTPMTQQVGRVVMIALAVLFGVFAVANVDSVEFNYIFGEAQVALILLLVVSFVLGAAVAWLATLRSERRRR